MLHCTKKKKRLQAAIEIMNKAIENHPKEATLYVARAGVKLDMLRVESALTDIEKAIELDPEAPDAYILRGEIYLSYKKKSKAKQDFEKAIQLGTPVSELLPQLHECR